MRKVVLVETRVRVPCGLKKRLNMNKIKEVWRDEGRERHLVC